MLSDWELDLFSALARHDLLLARARALVEHDDLRTARVQFLLAVARARRCAGDDLLVLQAIEYFLVERDADVHGQ